MGANSELPRVDAAITRVSAGDNAFVISVEGELDLYSTPQLTAELEALVPDGPHVVLDLTAVSFLDSTAIGSILGASRRLRESGGDLAVVCPGEPTRRLLTLVGVDRVVPLYESTDRALEHLVGTVVLRKLEQLN
jgi:anti-sigma B factor antagonist